MKGVMDVKKPTSLSSSSSSSSSNTSNHNFISKTSCLDLKFVRKSADNSTKINFYNDLINKNELNNANNSFNSDNWHKIKFNPANKLK
jgi:hypothetical protein